MSLLALGATARHADAQQGLQLDIRAGRVTLHAQNVPLRQVLTEWARVGGTKFVNAEGVTGNPVTLDLKGVSERQALDTLLRNVAGYVLASRPPSDPGASAFDRVVILASSTAPRVAPQPAFGNGPANRFPQPPQPQPDQNDPEENPGGDVAPGNRVPRPVFPPGVPRPVGQPQPDPPDPPENNSPGPVTVSPSNPFGLPAGSSSTPGVVTPVPQPQQPGRPPRIQDPD